MTETMMTKTELSGKAGYAIPCLYQIPPQARRVVLACHGFGSSKDSGTNQELWQALLPLGLGYLCFDFPGHGESRDEGLSLRIGNCLDDIAAAEVFALAQAPEAELCYFGSSFGAYLLSLYLALRPHQGQKAMLRCAAVTMPNLFEAEAAPEDLALLEAQGWCWVRGDYQRPFKVTPGFRRDLQTHDAFSLCRPDMAELLMIHGDADETAPLADAQAFAQRFKARLLVVAGANHRFEGPGQTGQVVAAAKAFFANA